MAMHITSSQVAPGNGLATAGAALVENGRDTVCAESALASAPAAQSAASSTQPAESEVASLRQRVKSLTQQASMAEVATTALHNVGNVLNSVNVSLSVVSQRLRESRVPKSR